MVQATQMDHLSSAKGNFRQEDADEDEFRKEIEKANDRSNDKLKIYIQQLVSVFRYCKNAEWTFHPRWILFKRKENLEVNLPYTK